MFSAFTSDGKMFGYGFVQFSSLAEAKEAMSQMNAKPILGEPLFILKKLGYFYYGRP